MHGMMLTTVAFVVLLGAVSASRSGTCSNDRHRFCLTKTDCKGSPCLYNSARDLSGAENGGDRHEGRDVVLVSGAAINVTKTCPPLPTFSGLTLHFSVTVLNGGDVPLTNVRITDVFAPDCNRNISLLESGQRITYNCSRSTVITDDSITTLLNAFATPRTGADVRGIAFCTAVLLKPKLGLDRTCPASQTLSIGDTMTFSVTVRNLGGTGLSNVIVSDPHAPDCSRIIGVLDSFASSRYSCQKTVTAYGNQALVATASGTAPTGGVVSFQQNCTLAVSEIAGDLRLSFNALQCFAAGQPVSLSVQVTNPSPAASPVTGIVYSTQLLGENGTQILPLPTVQNCPSSLAAGASASCVIGFVSPYESMINLTVVATGQTLGGTVTVNVMGFFLAGNPIVGSTGGGAMSNPTCAGACNGSVTVYAAGTAPLSYSWNTGATTSQLGNLCSGSYVVTVSDAFGCNTTKEFVLTAPPSLSVLVSFTNVSCFGGTDGTAVATPSGGTLPYTYLWSSGATTSSLSGVAAGMYNVTVHDGNGCTTVASIAISSPLQLSVSVSSTSVPCGGEASGTATAVPTGGTRPFSYLWSNGQTTATASGLVSASYSVTVSDSCAVTASAVIQVAGCSFCTFPHAYWSTHYPGSVAPDSAWIVCNCYNKPFYSCAKTWKWFSDASAKGSATISSGKQYIAAYLNVLKSGLDPSIPESWNFNTTIQGCYVSLKGFYSGTCASSASLTASSNAELLRCGSVLEAFNNGQVTGFPSCRTK